MGSLYKRIVTMGMISFTAFLAWIYCILNYKDEPVYIGIVSLILVVSIYALLNGIIGLHSSKEKKIQNYITETVASAMAGINNQDTDNSDMERLAKASYVQLRKANSAITQFAETSSINAKQNMDSYNQLNESTKQLVAESVNKAVKVMVKYDQNNNEKLVGTILELNKALSDMNREMTSIKQAVLDMELNVPVSFNGESSDVKGSKSLDMFDGTSDYDDITGKTKVPAVIDEDDILDKYSHEEVEAMFEASKEERRAKSQDDFKIFEHPEAMEQDFIDTLLTHNEAKASEKVEVTPEPATADVIPFPATETKQPEPQSEPDFDPNKQLSADEIAALFASVNNLTSEPEPVEEIKEEPAPEPINDDPNRQLSADEIAALFASMQ